MGGVAEGKDITQGLPRVEELLEARPPKAAAILSDLDGVVSIKRSKGIVELTITESSIREDEYKVPPSFAVEVWIGVPDSLLPEFIPAAESVSSLVFRRVP